MFPILKDEKFNDTWHRSFTNQARTQDVLEVLDHTYTPATPEDIDLFDQKKHYLYTVLENTVLTDRGKAIVRQHEATYDAQKVYKALLDHHLTSTKAMMDSSTILSYITSVRLGDGKWKGKTEGFITHWMNQVRLYERQVPSTDHFSDGQKRIMLENAVTPIAELRGVKNTADLEKTKTGRSLTFAEYSALLMAASTAYDQQLGESSKKPPRMAYTHQLLDLLDDGDPWYLHDDDPYDIDSPAFTIEANAHERRRFGTRPPINRAVRMPRDKWINLSDEAKKSWDLISDKDKAIILGYGEQSPTRYPTERPSTRQANAHEQQDEPDNQTDEEDFADAQQDDPHEDDTVLLANLHSSSRGQLTPGDIRRIMSSSSQRNTRSASMHNIIYKVSQHATKSTGGLVDRGANGGVAGTDVCVIDVGLNKVAIQGIDNHQLNDIPLGTVGGVVQTQLGPVIAVFHQYAIFGKGHSIFSPSQMEHYKLDVNDKSLAVTNGLQRIKTPEGYVIPLEYTNGLPRMDIRPFTSKEWDDLPHVIMTADQDWDPKVLDGSHDRDRWHDALSEMEERPTFDPFDEYGNYKYRVVQHAEFLGRTTTDPLEDTIDQCVYLAQAATLFDQPYFFDANEHETNPEDNPAPPPIKSLPVQVETVEPAYDKLRPMFGWVSAERIKRTFQHTTQYARMPQGTLLKRMYKSPNPALNVHRRSEPVACDIVYSDTPAVDNGSTSAVIFVGTKTNVTDAYGIKTDKQFINTLEDNIRERGAPTKLISDRAQVEISNKVLDMLRVLFVASWQSEPHQQHQNYAERRYQAIKTATNRVMDRTGAPAMTWLLCLCYVCLLYNHLYDDTLKQVPLTALLGITVDISALLCFHFWQKVHYKHVESTFPSQTTEGIGHIVGISEHVGNSLTWMVLTEDTNKILYRSVVRPHSDDDPNLRADFPPDPDSNEGETPHKARNIVKSRFDGDQEFIVVSPDDNIDSLINPDVPPSPVFDPEDLIGRTFLMDQQSDGQKFRAKVTEMVEDHESQLLDNPTRIKFLCSINNDQAEELLTYNQVLDYITKDEETDITWKFKRIASHEGPLSPEHPSYNGSSYNIMVEWENGEITSEPLGVIAADDPVSCAVYAKENNLLNTPGWKRFKSIAKRHKKYVRMVNQAKLRSYNTAPKYKYGYEVARSYRHGMVLDQRNGNTKWADAVATEFQQIDDYNTFDDKGHKDHSPSPPGYKRIRVHLVFDVKHDGRHKARLVADGHLTDIPLESVYSGVVSIRGFRLALFLAELNDLELWSTDIGNAYLEAHTSEKVYIIGGPEFGDRQDHILIIKRALYGLKSSGSRWHQRFSDCLRDMGFSPCKAEPDIWLKKTDDGKKYQYVAVYVDDLAIAMENPQELIDQLTNTYNFKLKGTGPISFHLGMDFTRDDDNTLCLAPKKYIDKMLDNYKIMFGTSPRQDVTSPIEKGDHPETDTSEFLDQEGIRQYQSLIGSLQWVVTIGRFDVMTAVMTMSSFRTAPRMGHLDRVKRIFGYLAKMKNATIRIRTEEPDYSDIPDFHFDWSKSVYGDPKEEIPKDAPEPLGKYVTLTHFVDANLMHDLITGKSVTGILHLLNKTPMDWYSKKQATVETATYGSEFVASRTCVEQIIELRLLLRYLGVPIREKSYMFGDNKSVVDSSNSVFAKLTKRHTMLSFHRVREAMASQMLSYVHIPGESNQADVLSKHWGYSQVWFQLKALLFWKGDTTDIE